MSPLQVGVGVKWGMEAAVHSTRTYLEHQHQSPKAVVKLDFKNAFNTVRRDVILKAVHDATPDCYAYVHSAYSAASHLFIGSEIISSEEGVQQGDPLGPMLFCMAVHPLLTACKTELKILTTLLLEMN